MKFNIGDRVSFLNEKGGGKIISFSGRKTAMVLTEDGFEIPYFIEQLVLASGSSRLTLSDYRYLQKDVSKNNKRALPKKDKKESYWEIDLHIHELVDYYNNMSNSQMLEIQLRHFKLKLEQAIANNIKKVVFIHGVGEGVLKHEIRKILGGYARLEYFDGSYSKYGFGATEVRLT